MTAQREPKPQVLDSVFSISGWIDVTAHGENGDPDLLRIFDDATRRGVTVTRVSGGGGYSAQGNSAHLSFGIEDGTAPTWEHCGTPNPNSRYVSNSLTVFNGAIHAATNDASDPSERAQVHRYLGGQKWMNLGRPAGVDAHGIGPMVVHENSLYVAPWTYDWTAVGQLPLSDVHVYRLTENDEWEDCGQPGAARRIYGLASFQGALYASADDDKVHKYHGDGTWSVVHEMPTYAHPMHVYDGRLWVGTVDPGQLWSTDGTTWRDEGNPHNAPEDASQLHSFARFEGDLLVGSWPNGCIDRRDRNTGEWLCLGGPEGATEINALQAYNGALYAGALPYAEVARFEGPTNWKTIRRFNAPNGWSAVDIGASGWRSRQEMESSEPSSSDDFMRDWGRATSMVEHDGRLFVSTGNCTSAFSNAAHQSALGAVYALSSGTVVTSPAALTPGRHHVAAVRDTGTLRLFLDGVCVATKDGKLSGNIELSERARRSGAGLTDTTWHDHALTKDDIARLIIEASGTENS